MGELDKIYVKIINPYKFKYQTVFSAKFCKQDGDDQVLDEIEFHFNLNKNRTSTESHYD